MRKSSASRANKKASQKKKDNDVKKNGKNREFFRGDDSSKSQRISDLPRNEADGVDNTDNVLQENENNSPDKTETLSTGAIDRPGLEDSKGEPTSKIIYLAEIEDFYEHSNESDKSNGEIFDDVDTSGMLEGNISSYLNSGATNANISLFHQWKEELSIFSLMSFVHSMMAAQRSGKVWLLNNCGASLWNYVARHLSSEFPHTPVNPKVLEFFDAATAVLSANISENTPVSYNTLTLDLCCLLARLLTQIIIHVGISDLTCHRPML